MKKLIYIVFAVFALGLASCSKEDIQSTATSSDVEVPVWKSNTENGNNTDPGGGIGEPGGGTIVDPTGEDPEGDNLSGV